MWVLFIGPTNNGPWEEIARSERLDVLVTHHFPSIQATYKYSSKKIFYKFEEEKKEDKRSQLKIDRDYERELNRETRHAMDLS